MDEEPKEDNEFPVCCHTLSPSWARYSFVKPKTARFPLKSNPTSRTRTVVWKVLRIKESAITARSQPNPTSSFFFIVSESKVIMAKKEMDRHLSRNGATKDIKKDGAGGKYTWGKPGDEELADDLPVDKKDPMYVPPEEEN